MPPKSARKSSRRALGPRPTARGAARRQVQAEDAAKADEEVRAPAVEAEEKKVEVFVEEKLEEKNPIANGDADVEPEKDVKEAYEEEHRGEQLQLEDDSEFEHEEDAVVGYDEKDVEHVDGQDEEGDEGAEYAEDGDVPEEEVDMVDEEMEDGGEDDVEGEGFENAEEEPEFDAEEEERHEVVREHRKRKEYEVFVGGLDKDATEDDLRKVLSVAGEITEIRLMMIPNTKKNKGFAFLRYATAEQAKRAVSELKNPVVRGKQCGVAPSHDNDTLFVGNICKTWTKEHLKEKLKSYGVEYIDKLTLVVDTHNEGMNRGYAFLEFSSHSEAMDAYRCLQKRDVVFGVDRAAKVAFSDSFPEPDDEIMAQVKVVFIDGLPAAWDEDRVRGCLKKYGVIEKIELARNMPAAMRKDFGFVTFATHDNAVACAERINNSELGQGDIKVKVRARLSRPHQRPRVNHGLRGNYRISRGASQGSRLSYAHPPPRRPPMHASRPVSSRFPPVGSHGLKRPISIRDRRPITSVLDRPRHSPPPEMSYERRPPPVPRYPRSSVKWGYGRRVELPPRSRVSTEYGSRISPESSSYSDDYPSRGLVYTDIGPRVSHRVADKRLYADDGYRGKVERSLPTYREGRSHDYDTISGSKRPYTEIDDAPHRYANVSIRRSKARLDYHVSGSGARYADTYGDRSDLRLGKSHLGYGSSRSSSGQDRLYDSRRGISYAGGSVSGSDGGGMYSSSFSSNYLSRGSDVDGGSYSSPYSGRSLGDGGYYSGSGSGSYY